MMNWLRKRKIKGKLNKTIAIFEMVRVIERPEKKSGIDLLCNSLAENMKGILLVLIYDFFDEYI